MSEDKVPGPGVWIQASEVTKLRDALQLALLFHRGGQWTEEDCRTWQAITNNPEATTRALCDHIRKVLFPVDYS